jgi:hypothetical protein
MKMQRLLIALTGVNLVLMIFMLAQLSLTVVAKEAAPVLRGRALEIVDERGEVRASITDSSLRLKNENGREYVLTP